MPHTALVAVPELMFRAKIKEAAARVGRTIVVASKLDDVIAKALADPPDVIVVDLGDERIDAFETIRRLRSHTELNGATIVGFYSHVRTDLLEGARDAGCDLVLPRSAFVARLPQLLDPAADTAGDGRG